MGKKKKILIVSSLSLVLLFTIFWWKVQSTKEIIDWVESNGGKIESRSYSWVQKLPSGFTEPLEKIVGKKVVAIDLGRSDIREGKKKL